MLHPRARASKIRIFLAYSLADVLLPYVQCAVPSSENTPGVVAISRGFIADVTADGKPFMAVRGLP